MMSSIMMANTTGTSLSQGGSGVMNGVAALKASEAHERLDDRQTIYNRRQIGGTVVRSTTADAPMPSVG